MNFSRPPFLKCCLCRHFVPESELQARGLLQGRPLHHGLYTLCEFYCPRCGIDRPDLRRIGRTVRDVLKVVLLDRSIRTGLKWHEYQTLLRLVEQEWDVLFAPGVRRDEAFTTAFAATILTSKDVFQRRGTEVCLLAVEKHFPEYADVQFQDAPPAAEPLSAPTVIPRGAVPLKRAVPSSSPAVPSEPSPAHKRFCGSPMTPDGRAETMSADRSPDCPPTPPPPPRLGIRVALGRPPIACPPAEEPTSLPAGASPSTPPYEPGTPRGPSSEEDVEDVLRAVPRFGPHAAITTPLERDPLPRDSVEGKVPRLPSASSPSPASVSALLDSRNKALPPGPLASAGPTQAQVEDAVRRLRAASGSGRSPDALLQCLDAVAQWHAPTFALLCDSGLGRCVRKLHTHADPRVRGLSDRCVVQWKAVVRAHSDQTAASVIPLP